MKKPLKPGHYSFDLKLPINLPPVRFVINGNIHINCGNYEAIRLPKYDIQFSISIN